MVNDMLLHSHTVAIALMKLKHYCMKTTKYSKMLPFHRDEYLCGILLAQFFLASLFSHTNNNNNLKRNSAVHSPSFVRVNSQWIKLQWNVFQEMKCWGVTIQMKATEQYCPLVLYAILYKGVLTFESVDEILKCDHSHESYWAVLSRGAVYYAVQGGSNFWVCGWNPKVWPFKWKLLSSTFLWCCLYCCTRWF